MSNKVAAVVLAGGLGTRLRGVLPDLPKPMAPVAGRPFVEWVVRYLAAQGVRDVLVSTGYKADAFTSHFSQLQVPGIERLLCVAESAPLGTAGAFEFSARMSRWQPQRWLVLNGDSLLLCDLEPLMTADADVAILARWMEDASRYGSLEIAPDQHLVRFREKQPGSGWINGGVYSLTADFAASFPASRPLSWETEVFPSFLASGGRVRAVPADGPFLDIGLPETLAQAAAFIRAQGRFFEASERREVS